jgi:hypothetical protein
MMKVSYLVAKHLHVWKVPDFPRPMPIRNASALHELLIDSTSVHLCSPCICQRPTCMCTHLLHILTLRHNLCTYKSTQRNKITTLACRRWRQDAHLSFALRAMHSAVCTDPAPLGSSVLCLAVAPRRIQGSESEHAFACFDTKDIGGALLTVVQMHHVYTEHRRHGLHIAFTTHRLTRNNKEFCDRSNNCLVMMVIFITVIAWWDDSIIMISLGCSGSTYAL